MKNNAWIELSTRDEDEIWSTVYNRLGFNPSVYEKDFPSFKEPTPSITYSVSNIWGDDFEDLSIDLHDKAHEIFRRVTSAGDFLYALDWQHQCYKFFPDRLGSPNDNEWMIPALPNGDYYIFLEKSLKFGWLGHPWEQSICMFGQPLLDELKRFRPKVFKNPIRRKGAV